MVGADAREGFEQLRHALARVDVAESTEDGVACNGLRLDVGDRPRRMRDDPDPPRVARGAGTVADVAGMDDEAGREPEHLAREREVLGPVLPQRRDALVEDAVCEQPPDHAVLALHRVEVAVAVAPPDGQTGDEVVKDEIVEDDEARAAAQRIDDPGVRVGVVADVVEAQIGAPRGGRFFPCGTTSSSIRCCSAGTSSAE